MRGSQARTLLCALTTLLLALPLLAARSAEAADVAPSAVTAGPAVPAAPAAAGRPSRPRVGQCTVLTYEERRETSDPDRTVSCDRSHTARTIAAPVVPRGVGMREMAGLERVVRDKCHPALERTLSPSPRARVLSAYGMVWFAPTKRQVRQGARWLRCDLVLYGGGTLQALPTQRVPALGQPPHADRVARCQLGKRARYLLTTCNRPHAFRAAGTFTVEGRAYPGKSARNDAARFHCPTLTGGDRRWLLTSPSRADWARGDRVFVCSDMTTD